MMKEGYEKIGRVTTESVHKCTGKHWREWIALLEKAGARSWTHREIVAYLKSKHKLGPWWQQGVALGFELAAGKRVEGQTLKGDYTLTVTKSLSRDARDVWTTLVSREGLDAWLKPLSPIDVKAGAQFETKDGYFGEIRTLLKARRIRMTWQDPNWEKKSVVQLYLVPKPGKKSILAFTHSQVAQLKTQGALRARWKKAVDDFVEVLS